LEFGESFTECASREVMEECGSYLDPKKIKYVTTMNVRWVEIGYHNVGLFMVSSYLKDIAI
jgi:ADP-ribose pyrophosphatase YjhB (NUDIX family)